MSIRIGPQVFSVWTIDTKIPDCTAVAELLASGTTYLRAHSDRHRRLSCGLDTVVWPADPKFDMSGLGRLTDDGKKGWRSGLSAGLDA